jgi:hypothetical protein
MKSIVSKNTFSKLQLFLFVIVFSMVGILIWKSLAAPNPNLIGDLNNDNVVDIQDLSFLLSRFNSTNSTDIAAADINGDQKIDILDLSALLSHYGQTATSGGSLTAPTNLHAVSNTTGSISLNWTASTGSVSGYTLYRNGQTIKALGNVTTYTDSGLSTDTVYEYTVASRDTAGSLSPKSNLAPVITKEGPPVPPPSYTLDSSFDKPSRSNPDDYMQHVDFDVVCLTTGVPVVRDAPDDPIVFPGQPGASHQHVFTGNKTINASSTLASLESGTSSCLLSQDKASYWLPELYMSGKAITPFHARAYYRAGSLQTLSHIPHGLRIIAGDSKATAPQNKSIAGWQCRTVSPDTVSVGKQALIPTCASTDLLEGSVVFPNCWDGVNLDSATHKSHMSYSVNDTCDTAHPVHIPQLTIAYRYPPGTTDSSAYLASMNSGLTLHADFFNAWDQPTLDALVDRCINAGVHCGDVSPKHFPGPLP